MDINTAQTGQDENFVHSKNREYRQSTPRHLTEPKNSKPDTQPPAPNLDTQTKGPDDIDWKKRYTDLQSMATKDKDNFGIQLKNNFEELAAVKRELQALRDAQNNALPLTTEQLQILSQEYSEFDKLATTRSQLASKKVEDTLREELDQMRKELKAKEIRESRIKLESLHPDVAEIEEDLEFKLWVKDQPQGIQSLFSNNNVYDIARGIDLYKREKGLDKATQKRKKLEETMAPQVSEHPTTPGGQQQKVWTRGEIKNLTPAQFAKYAEEINKAAREGRVIN